LISILAQHAESQVKNIF